MTNTENAPVTEDKVTTETTEEKTIGEALETKVEDAHVEEDPVTQPKTVPEGAFLKEKMARKEAEKKIKELEESIRAGANKKEVSENIQSIAEEYNIDPIFLDKIVDTVRSETESKIRSELDSKFKPLEEKEKKAQIDKAFNEHFNAAISTMPEFNGVVNPEVIKALSLLPQNANKTFPQLIEETYGSAVTGKRTIPTTIPGGGKEPAALDYDRAVRDTEYFKEVMANPKLKKEYNERMLASGF